MKKLVLLATAVASLAAVSTASAHHSYGMFARNVEKKLSGTVKQFDWKNPHARLIVIVAEGDKATDWHLEMGAISSLTRLGWKRTSVNVGEKVGVSLAPLRDGSPGGYLMGLTKANGEVLSEETAVFRNEGGDRPQTARPGN